MERKGRSIPKAAATLRVRSSRVDDATRGWLVAARVVGGLAMRD
jgi:hypothetical protein